MIENKVIKQRILRTVIDEYLATIDPVGVVFVSKNLNKELPIQTIVESIQDLMNDGYVVFHGLEIGVVPTRKGYASYQENLINSPHKNEKGSVLIFLILIVFGLFAIAAGVIDVGFARLTQVEMQSASDSASLLGLRERDNPDIDPAIRDQERRIKASQNVSYIFDDDFDLSNDERNFGAGPMVNLSAGVTNANALQTISLPVSPVYDPQLQLNDQQNLVHGDQVAGNYDPMAQHNEMNDYPRDDFTPVADGSAFLVRMRRTNDFDGLDNQEDISSSAPAIPFLFGRATMMASPDPSLGYAPRFHGITVRSTSISKTEPVKVVGTPESGLGAAPFILSRSFWDGLLILSGDNIQVSVYLDSNGIIYSDAGLTAKIGQFVFPEIAIVTPISIGDIVSAAVIPDASILNSNGYVGISDVISGTERIIGFGRVSLNLINPGSPATLQLTKFSRRIAHVNASALLSQGVPGVSSGDLNLLLAANSAFDQPLEAPVLGR